ncbi:protein of unknown function [Paraburkholderia dioscoreae]|uniref:Uncharacterized protein n=1 Tax=Paraburkholderia dioscoreae TaxID=2604047 RepID=A0A5Q4ZNE6_9BURK|nr:protein of unknown function [Paraburkholderia dioscoreae]
MHSCPGQPSGLRALRPRPYAAISCHSVSRCLHRKAARGRIPVSPAPEGALAGHERMFLIEGVCTRVRVEYGVRRQFLPLPSHRFTTA